MTKFEFELRTFSGNGHQGMPLNKLRVVVYSLIVSRIGYALPAWGGFVSVELCCKTDAMFKRLKRYGYTTDYLLSQTC